MKRENFAKNKLRVRGNKICVKWVVFKTSQDSQTPSTLLNEGMICKEVRDIAPAVPVPEAKFHIAKGVNGPRHPLKKSDFHWGV